MIVGQNALLNQYTPTFFIKNLQDGQSLRYDSVRKAFVNSDISGAGGADRLGELLNVSSNVDNVLALQNGQALVYNSFTSLWEGQFIDYNTLINKPTTTGGTVTSVSVNSVNGITGTVINPTTTPAISLTLTNITPMSVASVGTVTGSNLSGTNTGDQVITLTGDVLGTGTTVFSTSLATVNLNPGSFGSSTQVPTFTVDAKGRITSITNTTISAGSGSVTSVGLSGGSTGLSVTGSPITTSGTMTLTGTLNIANGGTGQTTAAGAINALVPSQAGNTGKFLTTNGSTISWASMSGTGTVTSVAATGTQGVTVSGSPITTNGTITVGLGNITPTSVAATGTVTGSNLSGVNTGNQTITLTGDVTGSGTGTFAATLSATGVSANTYGTATQVPQFTVDSKGRISNVINVPISGGSSNDAEIVVFHYSSGGAGNLSPGDAIFSQTAGVSAVVADGANAIVNYTFTGKSNPPKSITTYGQNYSLNTFNIKDTTSLPSASIAGGGTSSAPDLANGLFGASNVLTLQTRMSDTGASAGIGQRAWLVVVFGF